MPQSCFQRLVIRKAHKTDYSRYNVYNHIRSRLPRHIPFLQATSNYLLFPENSKQTYRKRSVPLIFETASSSVLHSARFASPRPQPGRITPSSGFHSNLHFLTLQHLQSQMDPRVDFPRGKIRPPRARRLSQGLAQSLA